MTTSTQSNGLAVFAFGDQMVRVTDREGEPWFIGRDICASLGLTSVAKALGRLPEDEKGVCNVHTPGGEQEQTIVSEPGMYRLVLTSRTEPAERFKKWLVTDVLPTIRKTGSYGKPSPQHDRIDAKPTEEPSRSENAALVALSLRVFGQIAARELWFSLGLNITPNMLSRDANEVPLFHWGQVNREGASA